MLDLTPDISRTQSISPAAWELSSRDQQRNDERNTFAATFNRAKSDTPKTPQQEAREAAEGLVSMAFLQPILKQMRESNNTAAPFGPGKGEQSMRTMLDQAWSDNIVKNGNWSLVNRVEQRMLDRLGHGTKPVVGPQTTSLAPPAPTKPTITTLHTPQVTNTTLPSQHTPTVTNLAEQAPPLRTNLR